MSKFDNAWKFVHNHPWISYWVVSLAISKVTTCITDIVTVLRTGQVPDHRPVIEASSAELTGKKENNESGSEYSEEDHTDNEKDIESEEASEAE